MTTTFPITDPNAPVKGMCRQCGKPTTPQCWGFVDGVPLYFEAYCSGACEQIWTEAAEKRVAEAQQRLEATLAPRTPRPAPDAKLIGQTEHHDEWSHDGWLLPYEMVWRTPIGTARMPAFDAKKGWEGQERHTAALVLEYDLYALLQTQGWDRSHVQLIDYERMLYMSIGGFKYQEPVRIATPADVAATKARFSMISWLWVSLRPGH